MAQTIQELLKGNQQYIDNTNRDDPDRFATNAKGQSPKFLWIGCSDSRVPASQVTQAAPGSIFVQRNIANMVVLSDVNLLSVVNYAVKALGVEHIIVCGHYGCGGVQAAMSDKSYGFLDNWLAHIKDVYRLNQQELDGISDEQDRWNRYVELNVKEQVANLARVSFIQEAWRENKQLNIHGWVYSLGDGKLKDLGYTMDSADDLAPVYQYKK